MNTKVAKVSCELGGKTLSIETGKLAKQSDGSVVVRYGDTMILATAVSAKEPRPGQDWFPLTVEMQEKYYAAGKIPGGFFKREGRPSNNATLSARMIDRPIRPLFPEGYLCDTQVAITILSLDLEADVDVATWDIPFNGPTAACRMGRIDGKYVVCPTWQQIKDEVTDLEILIACTKNAVTMIEGGAREVPEAEVLEAILKGHEEIKKICGIIEELRGLAGKPKREFEAPSLPSDIVSAVKAKAEDGLGKALRTKDKQERYGLIDSTKKACLEAVCPESEKDSEGYGQKLADAKQAFEDLKYDMMRGMILKDKVRIDGRDSTTIRQINCETGVIPRTHGSSLFTRGETQVLAAITLGTGDDEQIIDTVYENTMKTRMLHYNFPPYSVGETGRFGGQSRREIGHGALAERSVMPMIPRHEDFPYTVRIVCETLESNGSSSMGSVCSASMALMDAGVPVKKPVAGIAMGLIKEDSDVAILSDILGDEDHLGDMDFKVAGTKDGITGIQMDIKIEGIDESIMKTALAQAKEGRLHILGKMAEAIEQPRADLAEHAPRITSITVPVDRIGEIIGPGGKIIKGIIAESGCKVDINDDGRVNIASTDGDAAQKAISMIQDIIAEVEVGKIYKGVVKKIVDFGAFVGVLPNQDGLLHISEIAHERVNSVHDHFKEGDEVEVKVIDVDPQGKVRLSRKVLLEVPEGFVPEPQGDRGPRGGGRGGRGGDRDRGGRGGRGCDRGGRGGRGGDRGGRGGDRSGAPRH